MSNKLKHFALILVAAFLAMPAQAHDTHADATYMANEAVLVVQGETKVMFDPFYASGLGTYPEVPDEMETPWTTDWEDENVVPEL